MKRVFVVAVLFTAALGCGSRRLSVGSDPLSEGSGGKRVDSNGGAGGSATDNGGNAVGTGGSAAGTGGNAVATTGGSSACPPLDVSAAEDRAKYLESCTEECPCRPVLGLLAGGLGGPGDTDGVGAQARFGFYGDFAGTAMDPSGALYVADRMSHTIRKVRISTGEVSVIAGASGAPGSADGVGQAAHFSFPVGVALDGKGNLFVTDTGNDTIRKIVLTTGQVTTLAGLAEEPGRADGTGSAARFFRPSGVAADGVGNLFVADNLNDLIRQVVIATGQVSTLAGALLGGSNLDGVGLNAAFYGPNGIAADGAGHLFVADTGNFSIRKIDIATRAVTTLRKTGGFVATRALLPEDRNLLAEFWAPGDVALDGAGHLYVADSGNSAIRVVDLETGEIGTVAGSPDARGNVDGSGPAVSFMCPAGITLDGRGSLLVADSQTATVRSVSTSTGTTTTVAGLPPNMGYLDGVGAATRFMRPSDIVSDGDGNLIVLDQANAMVRSIASATGTVTTLLDEADNQGCGTGYGFGGLASDGAGGVYLSLLASLSIVRFDVATRTLTPVGTFCPGDQFFAPSALAAGRDGELFAIDVDGSTVHKIDVATGSASILAGSYLRAGSADGTGTAAQFNRPSALVLSGLDLFVSDNGNSVIRKIDVATGTVTTLAGLAGEIGSSDGVGNAARFYSPGALALDGLGNLFVADSANHTIRKIVIETGAVTTVIGSATHFGAVLGPLPGVLNLPSGLAFSPSGDLFISDGVENAVFFARLPAN